MAVMVTKDDLRTIANGLLADGLDVSQLTKSGRDELRQAIDRILVLSGYANDLFSREQCEDFMRQTANRAIAAEREACAKVAEKLLEHSNANYATAAELIAAAIRARKDNP